MEGCIAVVVVFGILIGAFSFAGIVASMIFAFFGVVVPWYLCALGLWLVNFTIGMLRS